MRRIAPNGTISTFANAGGLTKIVFGPGGFLYGSSFNRPGRYDSAGHYTPIAGSGEHGFSGDGGPALEARVDISAQASGVAVDAEGNFFFHDSGNRRVRAVRYGALLAPPNASISGTAEGSTLRFTVRDKDGALARNVRVDFAVPAGGASCTLSNSFAITDANGVATVTCATNCVAGSFRGDSAAADVLVEGHGADDERRDSVPSSRRAALSYFRVVK